MQVKIWLKIFLNQIHPMFPIPTLPILITTKTYQLILSVYHSCMFDSTCHLCDLHVQLCQYINYSWFIHTLRQYSFALRNMPGLEICRGTPRKNLAVSIKNH